MDNELGDFEKTMKSFGSESAMPEEGSSMVEGVPDYTRPLNIQMREARQKETKGDFTGAIQLYQGIIVNTKAVDRYIVRAYYRIGLCYLEMGQEDKAAEYFQRVISQFPKEKDVPRAKRALEKINSDADSKKSIEPGKN